VTPAVRLGVISDTHGYLDPRIASLFEGCAHILHAGDIGPNTILLELEHIAPVTAVLGNNDFDLQMGEFESLTLEGKKFLVHHIVTPGHPSEALARRLARDRPDVVVFGHTHKPFAEQLSGVLYFNPGYAGKPRFKLARSAAILHLESTGIRHEFLSL